MTIWSPSSWQGLPASQQPVYADPVKVAAVVSQLAQLPPLVTSWETETLKAQLADAAEGRRFLLQGGDCAESFEDCTSSAIASKLKILLQMSLVLANGLQRPVIRVGRFAGQYAKPRSSESEARNGGADELPAYRGDLVNRPAFTAEAREPDPELMLRGYERAALTLNFIRALIDGGFADLHHPEYWDLDFVKHSPRADEYRRMVEHIAQSLRFLETLAGASIGQISRVDFFTSHEGLHLLYEQAQTRTVPRRTGWYNLSTHLPWIGMRTAKAGGAHEEYFRGIRNPIAVKIGPPEVVNESVEVWRERIVTLVETLNPGNEQGRLTIIHRFGAHDVARLLPELIRSVEKTGKRVLWCCDPMHGNTQEVVSDESPTAESEVEPLGGASRASTVATMTPHSSSLKSQASRLRFKTRKFEHIVAEVEQSFEIHARMGTCLGGVHVEVTGENVTECTGGARNVSEADLQRAYRSQVDPRLNYEQSLELAMVIARRGSAI